MLEIIEMIEVGGLTAVVVFAFGLYLLLYLYGKGKDHK